MLIMDRMGKYLNTLTFRKPSSIGKMMICQNHIYCRSNNLLHSTLYRLDKNTGELLSQFDNIAVIDAFTALPDQIFLCLYKGYSFVSLLPDLSESKGSKLISPYLKGGISRVRTMRNVNEELVIVISEPTDYPIQIFNKKGTFLRAIAVDIPVLRQMTEVNVCIDKYWNVILSLNKKKVNVYDKGGKFLTSIGQEGDEYSRIYYPRGIALDTDENLIVCNNRKQNILQAYRMTN